MLRLLTKIIALVLFVTTGAFAQGFGGIGVDGVQWEDGRIAVKQVVAGGPAHLAGIKSGDIITHIDGKATEGSSFRDMVENKLRGKAGTTVVVRLKRPGEKKPLEFRLVRRQLVPPAKPAK